MMSLMRIYSCFPKGFSGACVEESSQRTNPSRVGFNFLRFNFDFICKQADGENT